MRIKYSAEIVDKIIEGRKANRGYTDIGNELGLSKQTVRDICRRVGYAGQRCERVKQERKKNTYVPKPIRICKCLNCGKEFQTKKRKLYCSDHCRNQYNHRDYVSKAVHKEYVCKYCGTKFISNTAKQKCFCSIECCKKFHDRSNKHRDSRLSKEQIVDTDISLFGLIYRDDNICYLCGKQCNLYDYWYDDRKKIVCGDDYPSIDHVIPISKGGEHSWENIRLAHRGCNSRKGAK